MMIELNRQQILSIAGANGCTLFSFWNAQGNPELLDQCTKYYSALNSCLVNVCGGVKIAAESGCLNDPKVQDCITQQLSASFKNVAEYNQLCKPVCLS